MASPPRGAVLRTLLAEIDAEIVELQAKLNHLAVTRKLVADALESVVSILALPPEITAEIFIYYCALSARTDLHDSRSGPLLLASVCRTWRGIAINLRPIWSSVQICRVPQLSNTEELLQCWFSRAADHLLDLDVNESEDVTNRVLACLARYSMHWRSFSCSFTQLLSLPTDDIQGHIPFLAKLSVIHTDEMEDTFSPITAFLDAPQLRDVTLANIHPTLIPLPWAQLTRLDLQGHDTAQCVKILERTPYLEALFVELSESYWDGPLPLVRLDHLHTLRLEFDEDFPDVCLLDHIVGPALKHLDIPMLSRQVLPRLLAFLARSECGLSSILFQSRSPSSTISILEAVTTVSEVHMPRFHWHSTEFTSFLNRIAIDKDFLPNLETLAIEEASGNLPYAELCEMLESRSHGGNNESARLKSFRFTWHYTTELDRTLELEPAISRRLQALMDDGLKIEIQHLMWDASIEAFVTATERLSN
ncbi:hypothetical protein DFH09DRAFT_274917 [Mycena vulgaris]|nr:hypothetical protein DFH09DRAFT_274917 [Mycena vulgaris]